MALPAGVIVRPIRASYSTLSGVSNGRLPSNLLAPCVGGEFLHPVAARKFRGLQIRGMSAGHGISYTHGGCYRSYQAQVNLFLSRYRTSPWTSGQSPSKQWNGRWYYKKPGTATAATPGTSNHGWGRAIDTAIDNDPNDGSLDPDGVTPIGGAALAWMGQNAYDFGFGWELLPEEPWHIRDLTGDQIPQAVIDIEKYLNLPPIGDLPTPPAPPPSVGFDPPTGEWGLYPWQASKDKPGVLVGMREADLRPTPNTGHIIYAQWAVRIFGGNAAMGGSPDGWWGKVSALCCAQLINNWNAFSGSHVPNNGGALGIDQWAVLDMCVNHSLGRI